MISIVIPVYNEKESLKILLAEIDAVGQQANLALEVLFVDDGSTDGSWQAIRELTQRDKRVRGLRFRRALRLFHGGALGHAFPRR